MGDHEAVSSTLVQNKTKYSISMVFICMPNAHNHVVGGGVQHDYVENINLEVKFIHGQQ